MYDTTPTNHYERKLLCNTTKCPNHSSPTYVNYLVDIGVPSHCPYCHTSHNVIACEYDYADVIVTKYSHPKVTRKIVLLMMSMLQERNLDRSINNQQTIEDVMHDLNLDRLSSRPKTYLTSHCKSCGGSFTTLSHTNTLSVQHTPPLYCIWCGSQSLNVTQEDTEETAFISLATHYNLPLPIFRFLYNEWQQDHKYTYLYDYITNDPQVQQIIQKLNSKHNVEV